MSNQVAVFNFNGFNLEIIEHKGLQWFIANPLATFLDYQNPSEAVRINVDEDDIVKIYIPTKSNNYVCVNESGLYSLVIRSTKPEAKKFKKWVTSEVLPSIRKTGSYSTQQKPMSHSEMMLLQANINVELEQKLNATQSEVKSIAAKVESLSVDLRNGVPHGFVSRANAYKIYSVGFSKDIFELVMDKYNVPTQKYVHQAEGHSTVTFGYLQECLKGLVQV